MSPTRKNDPAAARERVLHAALEVVLHSGPSGLTLEAVAEAAGMSKGGLLHHFPNKTALALAMLHDLFEQFNARADAHYAADSDAAPGRWMRAYIRATFDDAPLPIEVIAMLAGTISETPEVMEAVRTDSHMWEDRLRSDGLTQARVRVLRGATDNYWTDKAFGVSSLDDADRCALMDELLRLVEVTP